MNPEVLKALQGLGIDTTITDRPILWPTYEGKDRGWVASDTIVNALKGIATIGAGARGMPVSPQEVTQATLDAAPMSAVATKPVGALSSGLTRPAGDLQTLMKSSSGTRVRTATPDGDSAVSNSDLGLITERMYLEGPATSDLPQTQQQLRELQEYTKVIHDPNASAEDYRTARQRDASATTAYQEAHKGLSVSTDFEITIGQMMQEGDLDAFPAKLRPAIADFRNQGFALGDVRLTPVELGAVIAKLKLLGGIRKPENSFGTLMHNSSRTTQGPMRIGINAGLSRFASLGEVGENMTELVTAHELGHAMMGTADAKLSLQPFLEALPKPRLEQIYREIFRTSRQMRRTSWELSPKLEQIVDDLENNSMLVTELMDSALMRKSPAEESKIIKVIAKLRNLAPAEEKTLDYLANPWELPADAIGYMILEPAKAAKEMPVLSRLLKDVLNSSQNAVEFHANAPGLALAAIALQEAENGSDQ